MLNDFPVALKVTSASSPFSFFSFFFMISEERQLWWEGREQTVEGKGERSVCSCFPFVCPDNSWERAANPRSLYPVHLRVCVCFHFMFSLMHNETRSVISYNTNHISFSLSRFQVIFEWSNLHIKTTQSDADHGSSNFTIKKRDENVAFGAPRGAQVAFHNKENKQTRTKQVQKTQNKTKTTDRSGDECSLSDLLS